MIMYVGTVLLLLATGLMTADAIFKCILSTTVDRGVYGKFSDHEPFDNALCNVPVTVDKIGLGLFLNTNEDAYPVPLSYQGYYWDLLFSGYDHSRPTVFITHGFTDNYNAPWVQAMMRELLDHYDVNVIRVNWHDGASYGYGQSAANTRLVGAMLAHFIRFLVIQGSSYDQMHLIGHSLGAHVSGYAGHAVQNFEYKPGTLGRISGLDPAGPYFSNRSPLVRLDSTDADFVDTIHTDAEHVLKFGLGMMGMMGHADFFPQGGYDQAGCPKTFWGTVKELLGGLDAARVAVACSHNRVLTFYTSSIATCPYTAYPCHAEADYEDHRCTKCNATNPCATMGYHATKDRPGRFTLTNREEYPYCDVPPQN